MIAKKLLLMVAAIFMAVSFSACSDKDDKDDKDEEADYSKTIVGTWECVREVGYENGENFEDSYRLGEWVWTFRTNGTGPNVEKGYSDSFQYSIYGNTLNINYIESDRIPFVIKKLTPKKLVVHDQALMVTKAGMIQYISFVDNYLFD